MKRRFDAFLRALPESLFFICIFFSIIFSEPKAGFLALAILITAVAGVLLKRLFFYLGEKYGTKEYGYIFLPILGKITRPPGAKDCTSWQLQTTEKANDSGMPSGHSMVIACVVSLILINQGLENKITVTSLLGLSFVLILTMSARVERNCHSVEQVYWGSLFGFILSVVYYFFFKLLL